MVATTRLHHAITKSSTISHYPSGEELVHPLHNDWFAVIVELFQILCKDSIPIPGPSVFLSRFNASGKNTETKRKDPSGKGHLGFPKRNVGAIVFHLDNRKIFLQQNKTPFKLWSKQKHLSAFLLYSEGALDLHVAEHRTFGQIVQEKHTHKFPSGCFILPIFAQKGIWPMLSGLGRLLLGKWTAASQFVDRNCNENMNISYHVSIWRTHSHEQSLLW